ncbi:hypothetical protein LTR97_005604 [Elasticomyces elasticus]|uniref:F-box domain-containing protein n=1 Tax=Elasticomyces elasticus TaxID=574655 RepID=A0AAN7W5B6_9PEZI|nr:hypothetical protein LTR97_005604 [Elasticomyces elasticus]
MATPREQVLCLPELVEDILLQVHFYTLLFAQRVCKDWKQIMDQSPRIQKA